MTDKIPAATDIQQQSGAAMYTGRHRDPEDRSASGTAFNEPPHAEHEQRREARNGGTR